ELLAACAKGELKNQKIEIDPSHVATIVMAAGGYPDHYEKGKVISGLTNSLSAQVFHAGTKLKEGNVVTDGGRVLAVTGKGHSLKAAQQNAYETANAIQWEGAYFRKDIANDLLNWKG
ncbi:MAG TPA: phosphoribosylamine--glycine ligase, partial [Cytophagales bacterium]|nr:phosphoribosylamine--glycine ligase [Cytophagales bacterium]